jgi:hypothetical protein
MSRHRGQILAVATGAWADVVSGGAAPLLILCSAIMRECENAGEGQGSGHGMGVEEVNDVLCKIKSGSPNPDINIRRIVNWNLKK